MLDIKKYQSEFEISQEGVADWLNKLSAKRKSQYHKRERETSRSVAGGGYTLKELNELFYSLVKFIDPNEVIMLKIFFDFYEDVMIIEQISANGSLPNLTANHFKDKTVKEEFIKTREQLIKSYKMLLPDKFKLATIQFVVTPKGTIAKTATFYA